MQRMFLWSNPGSYFPTRLRSLPSGPAHGKLGPTVAGSRSKAAHCGVLSYCRHKHNVETPTWGKLTRAIDSAAHLNRTVLSNETHAPRYGTSSTAVPFPMSLKKAKGER
jgi:hypothetical protein